MWKTRKTTTPTAYRGTVRVRVTSPTPTKHPLAALRRTLTTMVWTWTACRVSGLATLSCQPPLVARSLQRKVAVVVAVAQAMVR